MATDLGVSITVFAAVGGALSGLTNVGKAMNTLKLATDTLNSRQQELGKALERNKNRLGVASAKQLWQEYDKIGASIEKLKKQHQSLQNISAAKTANGQQWLDIKGQWHTAVAAAGSLLLPVKLAIDFESSMADVKKVVNFDTPQQFKQMEQDILRLTREIPMAGKEIAAIVAAGGQSGVARKDLIGFASDASKMGVAFDMAAGQAGESMATLSNVLQIPIPKISRLGDAINHLSDNANSKASDIVNVLTRVGSDIKQLGMTENQGAAWGSTFLSMGKAPELAAQAIKGMVTSLSVLKAGGGAKELAQLGLTTKQFAQAMNKDANGAMLNLLERVKQLPKDMQYPLLMKMFGRQYADDALMLTNNVGEYNRQLQLLEERDASGNLKYIGSMQREFENRSGTTANQIQIFKNGMAELGITIGSVLLPTVNDFLGKGIKIANVLADWSAKNPVLMKTVIGVTSSLLAFKIGMFLTMAGANRARAAFLGLKGAFVSLRSAATLTNAVIQSGMGLEVIPGRLGTVMRAFSAARTVMIGFSLSSLVAMWPLLLAVGAIALAGWTIYKAWNPIKAFFAGLWGGLLKGLEPVKPAFDALVSAISPVVNAVGSVLGGLWETIQPFVQPLIEFFGDFFSTTQMAEGGARSFGEAVGLWIGEKITAVVDWVAGKVGEIKTAFDGGLSGILTLILNWSPLGAFYSAFAAVMNWFGFELPAKFTEFGANIISGLWNGLKAKFEAVKEWFGGVAGWFAGKFQTANQIHSPSRLFHRFGGWMMEGLQLGLNKGVPRPLTAIGNAAGRLKERFTDRMGQLRGDIAARVSAGGATFAAERERQAAAAATGGMVINYNPTINTPGGDTAQIQTALSMSQREFEMMFKRMMADMQRKAY